MAKQPKPKVWWCVKSGRALITWYIAETRKEAIRKAEEFFGEPWGVLQSYGYSVVKIEVREVTP